MKIRQPAWRQNSVPSYTQTPVHQPAGPEQQYAQRYPQGTPIYQDTYDNNNNAAPAYQAQQPEPQQHQQHQSRPSYLAPKPVPLPRGVSPTTVSFSGGIAVEKPVPKPNTDYYWTQQQHFYNNDDDHTINQGQRANSLQRNQQQHPETMQSRPQYNSQSSLPRSSSGYGAAPQQQHQQPQSYQGQQQQQPGWAHNQKPLPQPQPVYNSYNQNNNNNTHSAPSYDSAPQYPASVSYQSTAYNQVRSITFHAISLQCTQHLHPFYAMMSFIPLMSRQQPLPAEWHGWSIIVVINFICSGKVQSLFGLIIIIIIIHL